MDKEAIYKLLDENKNPRGIENWNKMEIQDWSSFGIGLTQLKKLAKQIGRNHDLAQVLWKEPNYDVKTMAILTEEPKKVNQAQIEEMVNDVGMWIMSHTWVQNLFCKVPFSKVLAEDWRVSKNDVKRRCGYSYLYYLSKDSKTPDAYFTPILDEIKRQIQLEENYVKDAMNNALFAIGQRSKEINALCISIAEDVGRISVYYGDNSCEAVDVIKHLTSERMKKKFS